MVTAITIFYRLTGVKSRAKEIKRKIINRKEECMRIIYCYTNKINGKKYVGQTKNEEQRIRGHKSSAFNPNDKDYNYPFHAAIRKYGWDNFDYNVLEQFSDEEWELTNQREVYYIAHFGTLTKQNGYNICYGGQGTPRPALSYEENLEKAKLFKPQEIVEIQNMLIDNKSSKEIYQKFGEKLTPSFLCNINTGVNYYNKNFSYPLRKEKYTGRFTKEEVVAIKERIKAGDSYSAIKEDFGIKSEGFLSMVNSGKYYFDEKETYPLCKKIKGVRTEPKIVNAIVYDLIFTSLPIAELAKKHARSRALIDKISRGAPPHNFDRFIYPLRSNQKENQLRY